MAENTARSVIENVRRGKRPNIYRAAIKNGYAETSAIAARPQKTLSYQRIIAPFIAKMETERNRAISRLKDTIDQAEYHHLVTAIDTFTKNIQSLSGGATGEERAPIVGMVIQFVDARTERAEGDKQ